MWNHHHYYTSEDVASITAVCSDALVVEVSAPVDKAPLVGEVRTGQVTTVLGKINTQ